MPDPNRTIYPNAPLQLVAFQLRYPPAPALNEQGPQQQLYERLRESFPIIGDAPFVKVEVSGVGAKQSSSGI
ncbi:MAG TPA: TIGR04255 family protein, partial [Solirubrobacteraceae bacterium]|nr:TIGR04255 family protein [Solirubrobacteraceae bacterium]